MKNTITLFLICFISVSGFCHSKMAISSESNSSRIQLFSLMPDSCKWLKDDAEWFYTPWSMMPSDDLVKIEVVESQIVEDQVCSVLGVMENGTLVEESKLVVFYNEESGLVHFYEEGNWKLLFDFSGNWNVGDTLSYFLPQNFEYYDISSTRGEFETSTNAIKLLNVEEEWITIDGEDVRVIHTQAIPENDEDCFIMESIIPGIGSKNGFMGRNCTQLAAGFSEYFRCFKGGDFSYSEVEDCVPPQRIWFGLAIARGNLMALMLSFAAALKIRLA